MNPDKRLHIYFFWTKHHANNDFLKDVENRAVRQLS